MGCVGCPRHHAAEIIALGLPPRHRAAGKRCREGKKREREEHYDGLVSVAVSAATELFFVVCAIGFAVCDAMRFMRDSPSSEEEGIDVVVVIARGFVGKICVSF